MKYIECKSNIDFDYIFLGFFFYFKNKIYW